MRASAADGAQPPASLVRLAFVLFAVGVVARLAPLADHGGRLLQQFPTEDGYLMLTIARNMALGFGMSTAAGTIPTNGTQPLVTGVWAFAFWLVGGDKTAGVFVVLCIEFVVACLSALALWRLGSKVLARRQAGPSIALLASAAWFASPNVVPHSMNCLETGFYGLAAILVAHVFAETEEQARRPWSALKCAAVGVLLGAAFWIRNDAAFLILAACLTYVSSRGLREPAVWLPRFGRALGFGFVSIGVAVPWLYHNYRMFGHIMPISGRSESLHVEFARNLHMVPSVLFEYGITVLPIPYAIQNDPAVVAFCTVMLLLALPLLRAMWRRAQPAERRFLGLSGVFVASLSLFYGLFFGAGYFMARYLFPASPLVALVWAAGVVQLWPFLRRRVARLAPLVPAVVLALMAGIHVRAYVTAIPHQHFQVVNWVREHVSEDTWVGAIQTGTLGFFHDRTINLDGKVNPEALEARIQRRVPHYAVEKGLQYLADWAGDDSLARWVDVHPIIGQHFEVIVNDRQRNLVVLKRKPDEASDAPTQRSSAPTSGRVFR